MTNPIGAALEQLRRGGSPDAMLQAGNDSPLRQVPVVSQAGPGGPTFADSLTRAINEVSDQQQSAAATLSAFLRGDNVELHAVMAASEEAQLSLEMLAQVRNKFVDAFRTLSNMQG